ncbi:hypothetical protein F4780DRAFT_781373 [Xylariomycetidae sp. FL0641]|nr:hypothetical protein F4780DRAFT_781373 [Xylariomycetidae sp. FL0641]
MGAHNPVSATIMWYLMLLLASHAASVSAMPDGPSTSSVVCVLEQVTQIVEVCPTSTIVIDGDVGTAPAETSETLPPMVVPSSSTSPPGVISSPPVEDSTLPPGISATSSASSASSSSTFLGGVIPTGVDTSPPGQSPTVPPGSAPTIPPGQTPTNAPDSDPTHPPGGDPTHPPDEGPTNPPGGGLPTLPLPGLPTLPLPGLPTLPLPGLPSMPLPSLPTLPPPPPPGSNPTPPPPGSIPTPPPPGSNPTPLPTGTPPTAPPGTVPTPPAPTPPTASCNRPAVPSASGATTTRNPTPLCTGLTDFSKYLVTVDGREYYVPARGDPLHFMLNDATGTEVIVGPDQVVVGGASFPVPNTPLPTPSEASNGASRVSFRSRPLPAPALQPGDSAGGRAFARQQAEDYIKFSGEMTEPVGRLLMAMFDFFARYDAPSDASATDLLGSEDQALDAVLGAAQNVSSLFDESRQEAFEGFLQQVLLLDTPEDEDDNDDPEVPGDVPGNDSCDVSPEVPEPGDEPPEPTQATASEYIDQAYAGLPGIQDVCQRVPWRTEALLNVGRFLGRTDWTSRSQLAAHLKKYRSNYMANQPQGADGLAGGGGVMVSGAAGFDMVSRTQLAKTTELFGRRHWYIKYQAGRIPLWYFNTTTAFLDKSSGITVGTETSFTSTGYGYFAGLDKAQGYPVIWALEHASRFVAWLYLHPTEQEALDLEKAGYSSNDARAPRRRSPASRATKTMPKPRAPSTTSDAVPPATLHQRLISAMSTRTTPLEGQSWTRDKSQGKDITVFIVDTGFSTGYGNEEEIGLTAEDLQHKDNWAYVAPNDMMIPDMDASRYSPRNIEDSALDSYGEVRGHGTQVAVLAVGRTYGIAQRARPYIIKVSNSYRDYAGVLRSGQKWPAAVDRALNKIEQVVVQRNLQGKAVVNFSFSLLEFGYDSQGRNYHDIWREVWEKHANKFFDLGIIWVQAAGNHGYYPHLPEELPTWMGYTLPQGLAGYHHGLLTVGACDKVGTYWPGTTPAGPNDVPQAEWALKGYVHVWAQGVDVQCVGPEGVVNYETGTSFAAPQVAGLVAYFLRLYRDEFRWSSRGDATQGRTIIQRMEDLIVGRSYRRLPREQQWGGVVPPFPLPSKINVAYNNVHGHQSDCRSSQSGKSKREDAGPADPADPNFVCPYAPDSAEAPDAIPPEITATASTFITSGTGTPTASSDSQSAGTTLVGVPPVGHSSSVSSTMAMPATTLATLSPSTDSSTSSTGAAPSGPSESSSRSTDSLLPPPTSVASSSSTGSPVPATTSAATLSPDTSSSLSGSSVSSTGAPTFPTGSSSSSVTTSPESPVPAPPSSSTDTGSPMPATTLATLSPAPSSSAGSSASSGTSGNSPSPTDSPAPSSTSENSPPPTPPSSPSSTGSPAPATTLSTLSPSASSTSAPTTTSTPQTPPPSPSPSPSPTSTAEPTSSPEPTPTPTPTSLLGPAPGPPHFHTSELQPSPTDPSAPKPTVYYGAPSAPGCANDECSECSPGFRQHCSDSDTESEVTCVCAWDSGCARSPVHRGECDEMCAEKNQPRTCEVGSDVDPVSYPNGFCPCSAVSCEHTDLDCGHVFCAPGKRVQCSTGGDNTGFCECA